MIFTFLSPQVCSSPTALKTSEYFNHQPESLWICPYYVIQKFIKTVEATFHHMKPTGLYSWLIAVAHTFRQRCLTL